MRRRRVLLAAAAGLASLTFAGCEGSTDAEQPSAETPEATAAVGSPADSTAVPEPVPGTCWRVPAESVLDMQYWFDDYAQVPCTEPHTTETVLVLNLSEPVIEEAKQRVERCWDYVRRYLDIDLDSWVPWSFAAFLPSEEEAAAGASWLRCDATFPATTDVTSIRTTSVSAKDLAEAPPADFWACVDEPPTGPDQPFVPCDRRHPYEQTGALAFLKGITEYPNAAELRVEARRQCREGVPPGYEDVSVDAAWDPASTLAENGSIAGWCFMFHADGHPLPAR